MKKTTFIPDVPTKRPRSKKAMLEYLAGHKRYNTMNSWNRSTSYANEIKVNYLQLTTEQCDRAYEMLNVEDAFDESGYNVILQEFDRRHGYSWQIGTNGRSGGYLVLYTGGQKPSEYKSHCTACGQRNFKEATPDDKKCGRCGKDTRVNYTKEPMQTFSYPGKGVDMERDYEEWSKDALNNRVEVVWDFDQTCEAAVAAFIAYADEHQVEEQEVFVPKKILVAVAKE